VKMGRQTSPSGLNAAAPLPTPYTPSRMRPDAEQAGGESFQIAQLRAELANATAAIQAHSEEWAKLIGSAKGEVAGLCRSVKSERDMASRQANEHQIELEKLLDSSRRIHHDRVSGSSSLPIRPRNLGDDLAFISGGISVPKVRDVIERLLFKFEDSLVSKAGFIGGLFHTWRCQVALTRLHQNFDDAKRRREEHLKDRRRKQLALVMEQWAYGDKKGLLKAAMRFWQELLKHGRVSARIKMAMLKCLDGSQRGLMEFTFSQWFHLARASRMQALHEQYMSEWEALRAKEKAEQDAIIQAYFAKLEHRHRKAKEDMYIVFGKWVKGKDKGFQISILKAWKQLCISTADLKRRKASMSTILDQWYEGKDMGLKRECWREWCYLMFHSHAINKERKRLEDFMNAERLRQEEEERERLSAEAMRHERVKNATMMAVHKFLLGNQRGCMAEVWDLWHKCALTGRMQGRQREAVKLAMLQFIEGQRKGTIMAVFRDWKALTQLRRAKHSVHMAVLQALQGDKLGTMQSCFQSWSSYATQAKLQLMHEDELEHQKQEMHNLMNDMGHKHADEMQDLMSAADRQRAQAHEATVLMMREWMRGQTVGLLATVISEWMGWVKQVQDIERRHEAAKLAVMRFVEGDNRACVHMCMIHWIKYHQEEVVHAAYIRQHQDQIATLEEQLETVLAHNKTHLMKYAAMMGAGDDPTLVVMVFSQWKLFSFGEKSAEEQRRLEIELEERARLHELAVTKANDHKLAVMEAMGFKNNKTVLMKFFLQWSTAWQQARQDHIHKLTHNKVMDEYSTYLLQHHLKQSDDQLVQTCFRVLVDEAHHCKNMRLTEDHVASMEELRLAIMQLTQERQVLSEQLQMVYQQLDSVTDTLQKELRTKEELAAELREANDQMRKASVRYTDGSTITLSVPATPIGTMHLVPDVHDFSADGGSPTTGGGAMWRASSLGAIRGLEGLAGPHRHPGIESTPALPMDTSTDGGYMSSRPWRGSLTPRQQKAAQDHEPPIEANGSQSGSPNDCNWESAVTRMRDEGLFRAGEAPRL